MQTTILADHKDYQYDDLILFLRKKITETSTQQCMQWIHS